MQNVFKVRERTSYAGMIIALLAVIAQLTIFIPGTYGAIEYLIGEGDLLKITVYDNPDLTTEARVGGDGKISFPLIGEVELKGLTTIEAQQKIGLALQKDYIRKPQVSVFVTEYKSKKVTVLGEFTKPGLVELRGNATLMELISNAGGLTANASDTLVLQRKVLKPESEQKEDQIITVDLNDLLEKGNLLTNVNVLDGDSIYVGRAAFVYVTGEVKNPGAYKITKGLTVLRAVTLAGGFTQKASKSRTKVTRKAEKGDKGDKSETTISVTMEDMVKPDDVVTVPESFF